MKLKVTALVSTLVLGGCATMKDAPISSKATSIDTTKESIAFMTLKVANQKNVSYQPDMKLAYVSENKTGDKKKYSFRIEEPTHKVDYLYNEYVVSISVQPGEYVLRNLYGQSGFFPVMGSFDIPMYKKISIPENQVIYLGHIDATVVDRTSDGQLRAGAILPLIDQAVVGASGGTFRIDIQDKFNVDTAYIRDKYPAFKAVNIQNMTLSPWIKPADSEMQ